MTPSCMQPMHCLAVNDLLLNVFLHRFSAMRPQSPCHSVTTPANCLQFVTNSNGSCRLRGTKSFAHTAEATPKTLAISSSLRPIVTNRQPTKVCDDRMSIIGPAVSHAQTDAPRLKYFHSRRRRSATDEGLNSNFANSAMTLSSCSADSVRSTISNRMWSSL